MVNNLLLRALKLGGWIFSEILCFWFPEIVFDVQALLKNQKVVLIVVLRSIVSSEVGIGTLLFNEFCYFLKMKVSFLLY